jgi:hypothetical protein
MFRTRLICVFAAALLLTGCNRPVGYLADTIGPAERFAGPNEPAFAYSHSISLVMPRAAIAPRFDRARDLCLHTAASGCELLKASVELRGDDENGYSEAVLVVALPHNKVAAFEKSLTEPLPGESSADVNIRSQLTEAENVQQELTDTDRKLSQLMDYRDRLTALSKRPDVNVGDLIRIEQELSKTQSDLDQTAAQKRDAVERVAREKLTVTFGEPLSDMGFGNTISRAWHNGFGTLNESSANALEFVISLIPWLPIVAGGFYLLLWGWRLARRRAAQKT